MKIKETLTSAFKAIMSNKVRTSLTMLGIIIGVFAVIALVSLGQGATASITGDIEDLGSNMLSVNLFQTRTKTLTMDDLDEIREFESISYVSPYVSQQATVKQGIINDNYTVNAVSPEYAGIHEYEVSSGRFINNFDIDNRFFVAVIGMDVADELFNSQEVTGQTISINGIDFTVVGVLTEQGDSMMGSDDSSIFVPFTTGVRMANQSSNDIKQIYISASSSDMVDTAQLDIENYLDKKFDVGEDSSETYYILNQSSILSVMDSVLSTLTGVLAGIAAISLLVGGIGIMNIMLVSVTERTREIGIRKAIGAKRKDIITQFLFESAMISLIGGIIGIIIGVLGATVIGNLIDIEASISIGVILGATLFSIAVGVAFGVYPAIKASKMNPIEALRYE